MVESPPTLSEFQGRSKISHELRREGDGAKTGRSTFLIFLAAPMELDCMPHRPERSGFFLSHGTIVAYAGLIFIVSQLHIVRFIVDGFCNPVLFSLRRGRE